jgi:hypothetical protein
MQLLEGMTSSTGKAPTTIAYAEAFEREFGFSFNDIYKCQAELFAHSLGSATSVFDAMKEAVTKEYRRRQRLKIEKEAGGKK